MNTYKTLSDKFQAVHYSSPADRIKIKIDILSGYILKEEEGLKLVNERFNNVRSFDLISEENLRTHLRLKAMIIADIADYKSRIEDLESQLI